MVPPRSASKSLLASSRPNARASSRHCSLWLGWSRLRVSDGSRVRPTSFGLLISAIFADSRQLPGRQIGRRWSAFRWSKRVVSAGMSGTSSFVFVEVRRRDVLLMRCHVRWATCRGPDSLDHILPVRIASCCRWLIDSRAISLARPRMFCSPTKINCTAAPRSHSRHAITDIREKSRD